MRTETPHVLIVGGGIAGPALGVFLKRAGISSTVYEAYSPSAGIGGGLGLGPNGLNVLETLGVADELKRNGTAIQRYRFRNAQGRQLAAFDLDAERRFGQPMLGLARAAVAEAVVRTAAREGVRLEYTKRLIELEQSADCVVAHFEDGTSASGDLLIGADGVNSTIRRLALPDAPQPSFTGMTGLGGFVEDTVLPEISRRERDGMTFAFGANGFFGYSGADPGRSMWWTNLPRSEPLSRTEIGETSTEVLRAELLERFRGYFDPVPRFIAESESIIQLNVFDIPSLPSWSAGRVLLVGDAAHAVSPNAGQGASLALEDALLLARLLGEVDKQDYAQAFARFEMERKPRVEKIVAEGRRRGVDKQVVGPIQARVRELIMGVMLNLFGKHADDWVWRYRLEAPRTDLVLAGAG